MYCYQCTRCGKKYYFEKRNSTVKFKYMNDGCPICRRKIVFVKYAKTINDDILTWRLPLQETREMAVQKVYYPREKSGRR